MVYYSNGFAHDCVHQKDFHMVGSGQLEPHPNASAAFYSFLLDKAGKQWNMGMLFTDFLIHRGPGMLPYQDV